MRVCEIGVGCGRGSGNNNLYATDDGGNGNGGNGNGNEDGDGDVGDADNGRKICRECCVEKGPEGETWCFECVAVGGGAERGEEEAEAEGMVMG
ncbi:hypothetical protein BK809_0007683 [Diplodia seriata]|uniref:Uncharacterized protein n=1 Tax=Diplodia seriata TaxID=420778 RepID=A0A1S8BJE7_9PEZI|nr:hypothetical protein BK809_0007683 [Diplodia seriata]